MSEYVPKYDVWITQLELPMTVRGFCKRENDENCVVINRDLADEIKYKTADHEILHIKRGDLDSEEPVEIIENRMEAQL